MTPAKNIVAGHSRRSAWYKDRSFISCTSKSYFDANNDGTVISPG